MSYAVRCNENSRQIVPLQNKTRTTDFGCKRCVGNRIYSKGISSDDWVTILLRCWMFTFRNKFLFTTSACILSSNQSIYLFLFRWMKPIKWARILMSMFSFSSIFIYRVRPTHTPSKRKTNWNVLLNQIVKHTTKNLHHTLLRILQCSSLINHLYEEFFA